jgi:steroid delta-isomerase
MNNDAELARLLDFWQSLTPALVEQQLASVYASDAHFKDPFNDVRGHAPIRRILLHMFEQVREPRFVVTTSVRQGAEVFLVWDFLFRMKRYSDAPQRIRGASHISFDGEGRVVSHRDYWDAAEELYEKLPVLGSLMRVLKRAGRA